MAKEKTNKSAVIREMLKAHKRKTPAEISALLKSEAGIDVPPQYVSNIKFQMKGKRTARRIVRTMTGPSDDRLALFAAAELVVKAGGVSQARAALDAVAKVASIIE